MGKRVQQFHHGLVIVVTSSGEQKAHDHPCQADHAMQLESEVLHRFAATHAILRRARKVTGVFGPFVAQTRRRR